jgi:hypothetical protein
MWFGLIFNGGVPTPAYWRQARTIKMKEISPPTRGGEFLVFFNR